MAELTDQSIKRFLESAPLYVWSVWDQPKINRSSLWIGEIEAHCDTCKVSRPFQDTRPRGGGSGMAIAKMESGEFGYHFICATCKKQSIRIIIWLEVLDDAIRAQKVGERPRKALNRDQVLQKFFAADADNFEKAVVCLANGYGIGAFAYLRRIIERNIGSLLDLLLDDAQAVGGADEIVAAIGELRKESPMSEKIDIANKAVPAYLRPDGVNPLGCMYKTLSEGVHSLSDEECLEKAKDLQECIRYMATELAGRKRHRASFKAAIGRL